MKIYIKLALAYLKKQKGRTFSMILGVVLAIMLVFGFDVINESQSKKQLEMIYKSYGGYHGVYQNLSKDKLEEMKNDKDIEEIAGVASLGDIIAEDGTSIKLNSFNEKYIDMSGYSMKEGHLPKKEGEIVLESQALKQMGLDERLNQTIEFKIKKKYKDENGINKIFMEKKKFELVGIITKPNLYYENFYIMQGFTFLKEGDTTILPEELISYENIVKLKSKSNMTTKLNDIRIRYKLGKLDFEENKLLTHALDEYSMAQESGTQKDMKRLIVVTSMILIYNMFNISLADMIKQIGLLRAIGVSKRKVRLIVGIQSLFIWIIGTILGILFGLMFSYFGMKTFSNSLIDMDIPSTDVYVSMQSIKNAIEIGIISVGVSSLVPIWLSGRVSPLEALRKTDRTGRYGKRRWHHKLMRRLFGITGEMAWRNIGRNKIRALISIIAISMGGIIFIYRIGHINSLLCGDAKIMGTGLLSEMKGNSFKLYNDINFDNDLVGYTEEDIEKLSGIDGVKEIKTKINFEGFLKSETKDLEEEYMEYNGISNKNNNVELNIFINGCDNNSWNNLKKYIEKGGLTKEKEGEYPNVAVFNYYYDVLKDHKNKSAIKNMKVGDIITMKIPKIEKGILSYEEQKVRVGALLKEEWGFEEANTKGGCIEILIPEKSLMDMSNKNTYNEIGLKVNEEKEEQIYKKLKGIFKDKPFVEIKSRAEIKEINNEGPREKIKEYYIIVLLILIIAAVNIYGTIKTSLLIRTNEFAIMRAIGMTTRQIRNMIIKETIIYGFLSSILAVITGVYKYYSEIKFINNQYKGAFNIDNIVEFSLPIVEILQYTVIAMLICIVVGYMSKRSIEKMSIVEGMKVVE